jgi:hypothetical protein
VGAILVNDGQLKLAIERCGGDGLPLHIIKLGAPSPWLP